MTQTELLYKDPLAAAEQAAAEIAAKTGIAQHDVALVMGSGWVSAVDALGAQRDLIAFETKRSSMPIESAPSE